jgi:hypothetical protein
MAKSRCAQLRPVRKIISCAQRATFARSRDYSFIFCIGSKAMGDILDLRCIVGGTFEADVARDLDKKSPFRLQDQILPTEGASPATAD